MKRYFTIAFLFLLQIIIAQKVELKDLHLVSEKSIKFKNGKAKLKIRLWNQSKDTLYYLSKTCSWQDFYSINNDNLNIEIPNCDKNIPKILVLPPSESRSVELIVKINKNGIREFKVGLNIIETKSLNIPEDNSVLNNKKILWSSTIYIPSSPKSSIK